MIAASESTRDLWQLHVGEAGCIMTEDEVDAALERSDIDLGTLVRRPESLAWTTLGEAKGQERPRRSHDFAGTSSAPPAIVCFRPARGGPLTKEELAAARPPSLFGWFLLVAAATLGVAAFLADRYVPAVSEWRSTIRDVILEGDLPGRR